MAFSPLASRAVNHHGKFSSREGTPVRYLIIHHWAGTSGGDARLMNPSQEVSASYILYGSGELVGQVPEEYRPWTSGSWAADAPAVTVETQNSGNGGDWPVSDAAVEKLALLAADLCKRYGWGSLNRSRVRGHREFASTACPGPFLWARLDAIIARGNEIISGVKPIPEPEPEPFQEGDEMSKPLIVQKLDGGAMNTLGVLIEPDGYVTHLTLHQWEFWRDRVGCVPVECKNKGHWEYIMGVMAERRARTKLVITEDDLKRITESVRVGLPKADVSTESVASVLQITVKP